MYELICISCKRFAYLRQRARFFNKDRSQQWRTKIEQKAIITGEKYQQNKNKAILSPRFLHVSLSVS